MTSVYIHIPFCKQICSYCDFPKFFYLEKWIKPYLEALEKEIKSTYKGEKVKTIYIGGGTPSFLKKEDLEILFSIVSIFDKAKDVEFTIETNSEDITKEKAELFKKYGVNRVSIGVETFHPHLGKILERNSSYEMVKQAIQNLNDVGILNINLDLMYAVPSETIKDVEQDLEKVLTLPITHLSCYSLILEEHTKLYLKKPKLIEEELDAQMYERIREILKEAGFNQYEISNYAKKGYEAKHNLVYWNNEEYYGFGLKASSYMQKKRRTNTCSLTDYLEGKYKKEEEQIHLKEDMEYEMMLGLRKVEGVSIYKFKEKFKAEMEDIFPICDLQKKGLIEVINDSVRIPLDKFYLSNEILLSFLLE